MSLSDCVCSMGTVLDQAASAFDNRQTTEAQQSDHFNKVRELHRQKANMASIVKEGAIDDTKARARLDAINQELAQLPDPNVSKGWLNKVRLLLTVVRPDVCASSEAPFAQEHLASNTSRPTLNEVHCTPQAMATQEANRSSSLGRDIQQHRSTIDRRKESRDYSLLEQTQVCRSCSNTGKSNRCKFAPCTGPQLGHILITSTADFVACLQEPSTQNMGQEKRRANALSGACKSSAEATRRTGGELSSVSVVFSGSSFADKH